MKAGSAEKRQLEFMALYEPVHYRFQRYCQAQAPSYEEAKDLASDCLLKAFERFEQLHNKERFIFFLFGIARNILLQNYRKKKLLAIFMKQAPHVHAIHQEGPAFADHFILQKTLLKIPVLQREALILYEVTGFNIEEIAALQDTTVSNVKQRLSRARTQVKALLKDTESIFNNKKHG